MAVSVRSSSKNDSNTGTAMSVSAPTGTAAGDFVVVLAQHNGNTTIVDNTALTVSAANLTTGEDSDGGSSETTASITPSANKLILASVTSRTGISTDPVEPTITGCGLTWVKVATAVYDTTGSSRRRITLFRAMGSSPSTGSLTIDHAGQAQTDVVWTVDEITNADTSGTNGSGAIVQSVANTDETQTTGTLTVTLAAFANTNNATYGTFANFGDIAQTTSAGSGFTKVGEKLATTTNLHIASEFKATNDTTVDLTFSNATSQLGGIAIEIKAKTIFTEDINDWQPIPTAGSTLSVFSRTIQSGDPSTYNFTAGTSTRWACIAICFQATTPAYDVAPNTANGGTTDDATTGLQTIPAITTGVANAIHIVLCGWDTSATGTITHPSGYTLLQSANSGGQPLSAAYKVIVSAGSTGSTQYDNTEFGARIGLSFSVKESASATVNSNFFAFM